MRLLQDRVIKAYWWTELPNFGDALSPLLLERFADIKVEWAPISKAEIASIGSIIEHVPPLWDGVIVGSGRLLESSLIHVVSMHGKVSAKILSLRGPLTSRGIPGQYTHGDPGILADELVGPQKKKYDLGILPHWQDTELVARFQKLIPAAHSIKVIDPAHDALTVVREIGSCRRLVTSSLHGMIVADAFGMPRRVEACAKMMRDGGDFKFRDYSASIKTPFETGKMVEPFRNHVEDVKYAVYDALRALGRVFK